MIIIPFNKIIIKELPVKEYDEYFLDMYYYNTQYKKSEMDKITDHNCLTEQKAIYTNDKDKIYFYANELKDYYKEYYNSKIKYAVACLKELRIDKNIIVYT